MQASVFVTAKAVTTDHQGITRVFRRAETGRADEAQSADAIVAPLTGRVVSVVVTSGSTVAKGDVLVVVEAMKMEHRMTAPRDGVIETVTVTDGDQVAQGDVLVRLETKA